MDLISGLASGSQLLAYSHSTFQVLIKLYKQVKDGPAALRQQESSVRVLLSAVDSLYETPAPAHILTTLLDLSKLATEALQIIAQSQEKGFWGLRWAVLRNDAALSQIFASLREYRELLHFSVSIDTRQNTERIQHRSETTMPWGFVSLATPYDVFNPTEL
jgi:superfamily I DNA/RNA helicase